MKNLNKRQANQLPFQCITNITITITTTINSTNLYNTMYIITIYNL